MNHREGERIPTDLPVKLHRQGRALVHARLRDLSMSGAGIECPSGVTLYPLDRLDLWLSLSRKGDEPPLRIAGFVVRRNSGRLGFMFMQALPQLASRMRQARPATERGDPRLSRSSAAYRFGLSEN
jgi:hypothetical protein